MDERFLSELGEHGRYWYQHHRSVDPFFAGDDDGVRFERIIDMPVVAWWSSGDHLYPQVAARFGLKRWEPPKLLKGRRTKKSGSADCYPKYSNPRDRRCFPAFAYT